MIDERKIELERALLTALERCDRMAVPLRTLHSAVKLAIPETPTLTEVGAALENMERQLQVVSVNDGDRGTCWKITVHGRARIA